VATPVDAHKNLHSEHGAVGAEQPGRSRNPVIKVRDLAWLEFEKPDLVRAETFAREFGFTTVLHTADEVHLRGTDAGAPCVMCPGCGATGDAGAAERALGAALRDLGAALAGEAALTPASFRWAFDAAGAALAAAGAGVAAAARAGGGWRRRLDVEGRNPVRSSAIRPIFLLRPTAIWRAYIFSSRSLNLQALLYARAFTNCGADAAMKLLE